MPWDSSMNVYMKSHCCSWFLLLINPQNLAHIEEIIWYHYVRISYGPELHHLEAGMDGIERILHRFGCLPYEIGN